MTTLLEGDSTNSPTFFAVHPNNVRYPDTVLVHVSLHTGAAEWTVWGCDLTDGYVRINADYTT